MQLKIDQMFKLGLQYFQQKDYNQSLDTFQTILKVKPNFDEAIHMIGFIFFHLGQPELAIKHIKKAIEINPSNPSYTSNIANIYASLNQWQEAQKYYRKALQLEPDNRQRILLLAKALEQSGQMTEAEYYYQKSNQTQIENLDLLSKAAKNHFIHGQFSQAIELYRHLIKLQEKPEHYLFLGQALGFEGHIKEAIENYEKLIQIAPEQKDIQLHLAQLNQLHGNYEIAVDYFKRFLKSRNIKYAPFRSALDQKVRLTVQNNYIYYLESVYLQTLITNQHPKSQHALHQMTQHL